MSRSRFAVSLALAVAAACAPPTVPERHRVTVAAGPAAARETPEFQRTKGHRPVRSSPPTAADAPAENRDAVPATGEADVQTKELAEKSLGGSAQTDDQRGGDLPFVDSTLEQRSQLSGGSQPAQTGPAPMDQGAEHHGAFAATTSTRDTSGQRADDERPESPTPPLQPSPADPEAEPNVLSATPVFRVTAPSSEAVRGVDEQPREADVPPEVAEVLRRQGSGLQRCHDTLLLRNPEVASGNVSVRLTISPAGTVAQADVVAGTIDDAEFNRCILDRILAWRFPRGDANTVVTHSFDFGGPVRPGFGP